MSSDDYMKGINPEHLKLSDREIEEIARQSAGMPGQSDSDAGVDLLLSETAAAMAIQVAVSGKYIDKLGTYENLKSMHDELYERFHEELGLIIKTDWITKATQGGPVTVEIIGRVDEVEGPGEFDHERMSHEVRSTEFEDVTELPN